MSRKKKTYSIDHPRVREAGFVPRLPMSPVRVPHPEPGLLRATRDRLPRWG